MSIVGPRLPGARVLDLFAGSGALGLEALSRGAERVDFVEVAPQSLAALRANIAALGADDAEAAVHRADALRFAAGLEPGAYDVAFADPPYPLGLAQPLVQPWISAPPPPPPPSRLGPAQQPVGRWMGAPFAPLLGGEHNARGAPPGGGDPRRYGSTAVTLFRAPAD